MTTYRSRKSAVAAAEAAGFTTDQVTITKLATAKYELVLPEVDKPAAELLESIENPTVYDVLGTALLADAQLKEKSAKAPKATRVNRHWNDDGSLTLYVGGIKLRRLGGEENEEASEEELEDPEAVAEKYLGRRFPKKAGGWVWGRTTQGHNWHTKRAKVLREQIAALLEQPTTEKNISTLAELETKLAQLRGK